MSRDLFAPGVVVAALQRFRWPRLYLDIRAELAMSVAFWFGRRFRGTLGRYFILPVRR